MFGLVERGTRLQEQVVIGTPGTVLDWCQKLKFIDPKKIKVFVLDEADVMIATQGHQDQSIRIQRYRISHSMLNVYSGLKKSIIIIIVIHLLIDYDKIDKMYTFSVFWTYE